MQRTASCLAGLLTFLAIAACSENPNSIKTLGGGRPDIVTTTEMLDQSVVAIFALFPQGLATAATARWDNVKRKYAAGLSDPSQMTVAKQMLFELSDWVNQKAPEMNAPPNNEPKTGAAARAILYMSMYVYNGPETNPPPFTPSADVVVGLVTPGAPATIVTPTKHAGVQLEAGSVAENTIVVITQNPTPYPANCSGPLQTRLCQYPQFYTFDEFPHKRLLKPGKFNVCHVNTGENRYPLADHNRFRLAHAKPADPADYTPGSTIRDQNGESVELLPLIAQTFSTCVGNFYAKNTVPGGILSRFARGIEKIVTPRTAYAIDLGLGGLSVDFSPFNDVDPLGLPDLAVQSLSVSPTSVLAGAHVSLSYAVKNIGTATSASVPASIFLTPPAAVEGPPPVDQQIGSITILSLPPGATDARANVDLTIPQPLRPGTYRLSLVVGTDTVFPDTNVTNNSASAVLRIGIIDLGVLPGHISSLALGINDNGHIVGSSSSASVMLPFLWIAGQMTSLGSLGGDSSVAVAINMNDEVAGTSKGANGLRHAFRWKNGTMTDLGTLPGTTESISKGINSAGIILGISIGAASGIRGWTWKDGVMTDLGFMPGGTWSNPQAINDAGQILGSGNGAGRDYATWIWKDGIFTILPTPIGGSYGLAINANGVVVGAANFPDGQQRATQWMSGIITDLGVLPGDLGSLAEGIDTNDRIVGSSYGFGTVFHAFLWESGRLVGLGTLGGSYSQAVGINGSGQIVGGSSRPDGTAHATLWQAPASP
jgi:probable HAF family extracellular repeat protein